MTEGPKRLILSTFCRVEEHGRDGEGSPYHDMFIEGVSQDNSSVKVFGVKQPSRDPEI